MLCAHNTSTISLAPLPGRTYVAGGEWVLPAVSPASAISLDAATPRQSLVLSCTDAISATLSSDVQVISSTAAHTWRLCQPSKHLTCPATALRTEGFSVTVLPLFHLQPGERSEQMYSGAGTPVALRAGQQWAGRGTDFASATASCRRHRRCINSAASSWSASCPKTPRQLLQPIARWHFSP